MFNTDYKSAGFFLKSIIGGAFITIAMTGLDQEMMQKNISVHNLRDSQKNMISLKFAARHCSVYISGSGWLAVFVCNEQRWCFSGSDGEW